MKEGEEGVVLFTQDGNLCNKNVQVAEIDKPLWSVADVVDSGFAVTFFRGQGRTSKIKTEARHQHIQRPGMILNT